MIQISNRSNSLTSMKEKMQIFILLSDATYTRVFGLQQLTDSSRRSPGAKIASRTGPLTLLNVATVRSLHYNVVVQYERPCFLRVQMSKLELRGQRLHKPHKHLIWCGHPCIYMQPKSQSKIAKVSICVMSFPEPPHQQQVIHFAFDKLGQTLQFHVK